jgi:hypothetical protein
MHYQTTLLAQQTCGDVQENAVGWLHSIGGRRETQSRGHCFSKTVSTQCRERLAADRVE